MFFSIGSRYKNSFVSFDINWERVIWLDGGNKKGVKWEMGNEK